MTLAARRVGARVLDAFDFDTLADGYLSLWLSSHNPSFYEVDGSSLVQTAFDRSPRGQDAIQTSATERPALASAAGNTWFDFSLGNDYLSTTGGSAVAASANLTSARSVFAAIYLTYASHVGHETRRVFLETYPEYYGGSFEIPADHDTEFTMGDGSVETATSPSDTPLQQPVLLGGQFLMNDFVYLWQNGTLLDGTNAISTPVATSQTGWRLGTYRTANDRWYDGYIGEVVVIDRFLNAAEMAVGLELLARRWA